MICNNQLEETNLIASLNITNALTVCNSAAVAKPTTCKVNLSLISEANTVGRILERDFSSIESKQFKLKLAFSESLSLGPPH